MNYIIFDFDGTIADTYIVVEKVGMELARKYQLYIDPNEAKTIGIKKALKKAKFPAWKLPLFIAKLKKQMNIHLQTNVKPFKDIKSVLFELSKHYKLGIVSSNSQDNIECFLKNHGLESLFQFIHSDSSIFGKHAVLKRLLHKYKISPSDSVYVGDEDRDIQAAKKAHIPIISVSWGYNNVALLKKENPHCLIEQPQQLLDIVSQIRRI